MDNNTLKISYTIWNKHGDNLYCRVRQAGQKPLDVNLHTKDKAQAEAFVKLRQRELELYNSYILAGEPVPEDVARKLLRRGTPAIAQKGPSKASVSLRVCLDSWEADMRRRGLREQSISSYMRAMAVTVPKDALLSDVDSKHVVEWLATHDHCKSATRRLYSVALREFVRYLSRDNKELTSLLVDWPVMVRAQSAEKGFWTMSQMAKVISSIHCVKPEVEEAMKVYCWVMATIGSRQGETALLEWRDYKDGCLIFRSENTKCNKTRLCPLDRRVAEMLERLRKDAKSDLIFEDIPRTQPSRHQIVKYAVQKAKVPHGSLHTFRHSASMYLYAHCHDLKAVSQLLGHSEQTALKYYQASRQGEDLRELVDNAYKSEILLPDAFDDLVKAGLV